MAEQPGDRFRRYYAEKLWELIPPIYRHEDGVAERPGVLRALVEVLADQAAIVRRSADRLWEDQLIDFCDDWAVPYLGDLLGTRMVSVFDKRGRRADVANTIYYRRRAGTLAVLEGLVADITGWEGTVVEEFRRLARYTHGLDPAPAEIRKGRFTGTPAHGLPDLRNPRGAEIAWSAWDEMSHLPDVRRGAGGLDGRYGITKLGVHLFRIPAYEVPRAQPRLFGPDSDGNVRFTFDPSGRASPLYQRHSRPPFAFEWRAALEWELPARMRCEVLANAEFVITEALILAWSNDGTISGTQPDELRALRGIRFPTEERFRARLAMALTVPLGLAALHRVLADALASDCGKAVLLPPTPGSGAGDAWSVQVEEPLVGGLTPVPREVTVAGNLTGALPTPNDKRLVVDAENGIGFFTTGTPPAGIRGSYYYGLSGPIGAGTYDRPGLAAVSTLQTTSGGGPIAAPALGTDVRLEITDSLTYGPVADLTAQGSLIFQAANEQRPCLELAGDWTVDADTADCTLVLDGLWLTGGGVRTIKLTAGPNGNWKKVTLSRLTFDPGGTRWNGDPIGPVLLSIEAPVTELVVDACLLGCLSVAPAGLVEKLTIRSSVVHSTDLTLRPLALSSHHGDLDIRGSTVIGQLKAHRIEASELLCTGLITIDDVQAGCIRFSAFPPASVVPRAYRSQPLTDAGSLFQSLRFGDPEYAQLSDVAPQAIARGGDNGTEIGAWNFLLGPIRFDSLRAKVDEYLPFGLIPLYITET